MINVWPWTILYLMKHWYTLLLDVQTINECQRHLLLNCNPFVDTWYSSLGTRMIASIFYIILLPESSRRVSGCANQSSNTRNLPTSHVNILRATNDMPTYAKDKGMGLRQAASTHQCGIRNLHEGSWRDWMGKHGKTWESWGCEKGSVRPLVAAYTVAPHTAGHTAWSASQGGQCSPTLGSTCTIVITIVLRCWDTPMIQYISELIHMSMYAILVWVFMKNWYHVCVYNCISISIYIYTIIYIIYIYICIIYTNMYSNYARSKYFKLHAAVGFQWKTHGLACPSDWIPCGW